MADDWEEAPSKQSRKQRRATAAGAEPAVHAITGEKTAHWRVMTKYRASLCAQHENGACPRSAAECFYAHERRDLRRPPVNDDGVLLYGKDMCEQPDRCRLGKLCPHAHTSFEMRFHPSLYKVKLCKHSTDEAGLCETNGAHCSFAHGDDDLREGGILHNHVPGVVPRALAKSIQPAVASAAASAAAASPAAASPAAPAHHHGNSNVTSVHTLYYNSQDPATGVTPGGIVTLLPDGTLDVHHYKATQCKQTRCFCDGWHNEGERRRSPLEHDYKVAPCPNVFSSTGGDRDRKPTWGAPSQCPNGDDCNLSHTKEEQMYHPDKYKTTACLRNANHNCHWGVRCSYAHGNPDPARVAMTNTLEAKRSGTSSSPQHKQPPPQRKQQASPLPPQQQQSYVAAAAAAAPARPPMSTMSNGVATVRLPVSSPAAPPPQQQQPPPEPQQPAYHQAPPPPGPAATPRPRSFEPNVSNGYGAAQSSQAPAAPSVAETAVADALSMILSRSTVAPAQSNGLAELITAMGMLTPPSTNSGVDQANGYSTHNAHATALERELAEARAHISQLEVLVNCPLCTTSPRNVALYPCGHTLCYGCLSKISNGSCPRCADKMAGLLYIYP